MKKIGTIIILSLIVLVGCSGVNASKQEELASDEWVDQQVSMVKKDADSIEARMAKLDEEIKKLQGQDGNEDSGGGVTNPTDLFTDISSEYFGFNEIKFLTDRNVIRGYPDGSFGPNKTITRAQTAVMLVRELKLTAPADYVMVATDVSKNSDTYEPLRIAEYHRLMSGSDGKLRPNEGLRRVQMAVVLSRAFELEQPNQNYAFTDITSSFPNYKQINIIAHNNITTEVGKAFRPNETTTRAQFSLFMARAIHEPFRP